MFNKMKKVDKLQIIFDDDLVELLKIKANISDPENATYQCAICKKEISFDEIGGIRFKNGKLQIICEECL